MSEATKTVETAENMESAEPVSLESPYPQTKIVEGQDGRKMEVTSILPKIEQRKKNVAAYARVSTLSEEQEESFETQVNYYTTMITKNPQWNFAGVYADNGRSGLSAEKRPEFMRMITDALSGKIDVIFVKSISRFGRNSLEAQTYVHILKENNVEVRFEREDISSFNPQADLIFNFMTAIAEQESRSISDNVRWTYEKLGKQGIRRIGNNRVLGYDEKYGVLVPNDDAWMPELIFTEYAKGTPLTVIAKKLEENGGKRLRSNNGFNTNVVLSILKNEIYVGDRKIQKAPHTDMKTKRPQAGEEYESYYVTNDHEGIVSREIWQKVQDRLEAEAQMRERGVYNKKHAHFLYGKLFCGICGEPMTRKTAMSSKREKKYWICRDRRNGSKGNGCLNDVIDEEDILILLSQKLGIEWRGLENVNPADFDAIESVKVYSDKIEVAMKKTVA